MPPQQGRPSPTTLDVNGNHRVEIVGAPADQLPWLKSLGCFAEIIQYQTRLFVPVDEAERILAKLLKDG